MLTPKSDQVEIPDPRAVRRTILDMLYSAKASHLGTSMSLVEMLIASYASVDTGKILRNEPDRSRIIVSKGHGACATYAVMAHFGLIDPEILKTYHTDGTVLCGHVSHAVQGVEHSTGALGHGLSVATGCAIGMQSRGFDDSSVFALLGDGEIQEGSIWEALMLIKHKDLSNLITLIDNNRISSITQTHKVINMEPLSGRFSGFGFHVCDVDGHDIQAIQDAIKEIKSTGNVGVIVCNTVKGKGVPFAEDEPIWHYRPLNDESYRSALAALDKREL